MGSVEDSTPEPMPSEQIINLCGTAPPTSMGSNMKLISTALVALMMTAIVPGVSSQTAKADGGAILIGVGVYLAGDYVVGHTCQMRDWPFNVVRKVYYGLQGKRLCRYRYRH
jgi:hypothetical protein